MTSLEQRVDALVGSAVTPGESGAAVAIMRDGVFVLCKGYGLANVELGVAISPDTVFHIASITKQFTAVAILMLCERGLVELDAPIGTYLELPADKRAVTVRQLLNHTSGIRSYSHLSNFHRETAKIHTTLSAFVARIASLPCNFEPGARYSYNNSGYVLLGAIIERASGESYGDFLAREVFEPLGMTRTLYLLDQPIVKDRASGYQRRNGILENAFYTSATSHHAAGALGSTVRDLALWDRAIRDNRLIGAETLAAMLEPTRLNDGSQFPYGFGWGTAEYLGRRVFHHTGGIYGFTSHMLHFRDTDITTILLSNFAPFPMDRITRGLARAALGADEPAAPAGQRVPGAAYCGSFRADGNAKRDLAETAEGIAFIEPGGPQLRAIGDAHFVELDDPEISYRFGDLRDGKCWSFVYASPLWPDTRYTRIG